MSGRARRPGPGPRRLAGAALGLVFLAPSAPLRAAPPPPDLGVISEGQEGIVFEYRMPSVEADPAPNGLVLLRVPGCALPAEAGVPAVPSRPLLLALPPGARATVEILESSIEETDEYKVSPTPALEEGGAVFGDWSAELAPGFYPPEWVEVSNPSFLRGHRVVSVRLNPVRFDRETGRTRVLRKATVNVRFEGGAREEAAGGRKGGARDPFEFVFRRALLNCASGAEWKTGPSLSPREPSFGDSFRSSREWIRVEIHETGFYRIGLSDLMEIGVLDPKNEIGDPREIRLYSGRPLPLPQDLAVSRPDWMEQVGIHVDGEEDGSFDSGDGIEFFAVSACGWRGAMDPAAPLYYEHVDHPYSDHNVYWLTWGGTFQEEPKRIRRVDAGPDGAVPTALVPKTFLDRVHAEQDDYMDLSRYGEDGWFWNRFSLTDDRGTFTLRTMDADTAADGSVRVRFFHYSDAVSSCGTERARIQVNGVPSAQLEWNSCRLVDQAIAPYDYDSTAHWVLDGENRFDIQVAFRKKVYLCWIEMEYRRFFRARDGELAFRLTEQGDYRVPLARFVAPATRVFDTTDPYAVRELVGFAPSGDSVVLHLSLDRPRSYYAVYNGRIRGVTGMARTDVQDLRDPGAVSEYLIITADEFAEAANVLADARSGEFSVAVVRLSDVYANFSWGLPDPVAIRDFLAFLRRGAPGGEGPAYVLLLGDASIDFRERDAWPNKNNLPALFRVDRGGNRTNCYSTDDFFTYLDPDSQGDWAPDLAIGRLPAQSAEEAAGMVSKVVEYGRAAPRGPWRCRLLFSADDELKAGSSGGYDCGFLLSHTADAEELARSTPDRYEKGRTYLVEFPLGAGGVKPGASEEYIRRINDGLLFSAYVGHGGADKLADEELLVLRDVTGSRMEETNRPHLFTAWSCSVGKFDGSSRDCLAEALLKKAGGGAIGAVAASQDVFAGPSQTLAVGFAEALLAEGEGRVPVALPLGAAKSAGNPWLRINNEKYVLLSDPALRLAAPPLSVRFAGTDTLAIRRGTPCAVQGEVLDESGGRASWFNGGCILAVRAAADTSGYMFLDSVCYGTPRDPRARHVGYARLGPRMFEGEVEVRDGFFQAEFLPSLDAPVGTLGRLGAYVLSYDGETDGFGGSDSISITAEPEGFDPPDDQGPCIDIQANGEPIRDGEWIRRDAWIDLVLTDPSGIYQGDNDAFLRASALLDRSTTVDLGPWLRLERNGYRRGEVRFRLDALFGDGSAEGEHDIVFRAADNLRNKTEYAVRLTIVAEVPALSFRGEVLSLPNPFDPDREETEFYADLSRDADVTIQILTLTGRRIRTLENCPASGPTRLSDCRWDGRDEDGDRVANGVYLVRAVATTYDGKQKTETIGKVVVMRKG